MPRSNLFTILLAVTLLLGACASPAATPTSLLAATEPPTAVPPTAAPTLLPPTETPLPPPQTLRLATTTSTADSGLLDAILPDFESKFNASVEVIAVGTGQALELGANGDVDVVLVHSRSREDEFVANGGGVNRLDVMYNDFVIVGPEDDPAGIAGLTTGKEAFAQIAETKAQFVSRGDDSGTHSKEKSIWKAASVEPSTDSGWYFSIGQGMGETLLFANEKLAYTLADRGTWLAQKENLPNLDVMVGGASIDENSDKSLYNPYGVIPVNPEKHAGVNFELATQFAEWITSVETQKLIAEFGKDTFGQSLFYPNSDEYKATREVTVIIGGSSKTFTLADLKAMAAVSLENYETIGHKKGPLGQNSWAGVSLKDLLLQVDPTVADEANSSKRIYVTASDGWKGIIRWNQLFGQPGGGEYLADSYGCTECHGMDGEGKGSAPALAGADFDLAQVTEALRAGKDAHAGINPYTGEQLPDAEIAAIMAWLKDPATPATEFMVPPEKMIAVLAYQKNGAEMNGTDGLIQLVMGMDMYTSRFVKWVKTIEVK